MSDKNKTLSELTEMKVQEGIKSFEFYLSELGISKAVDMTIESSCLVSVKKHVIDHAANHWLNFLSNHPKGIWNIHVWFDQMQWNNDLCEDIRHRFLELSN